MSLRKANRLVDALAPLSASGQQQIGDAFPLVQILDTSVWKPIQLAQQRKLTRGVSIKTTAQFSKLIDNQTLQRLLQLDPYRLEIRIGAGMPQPLIAPLEHL